MGDDNIRIIAMGDSSGDNEEKYEIYKAGSDMYCVIGMESNKQSASKSGAKPRYKQSYREAWESMRDFKGWLTSVPGNTSKAYCKLCQKELHCHRLSLLKHKVTYKHQRKEEEQKIIKLQGEVNDNEFQKGKVDTEIFEKSSLNNEPTLFEMEGDNYDLEENVVFSKATTSESCNSVVQDEEGKSLSGNGCLSTHILDISKGVPATLVHVVLYKLIEGRWTLIHEGLTNLDGRYIYISPNQEEFSEGRYKLHYDVDKYFEKHNQESIFPFVEVAFNVKDVSSRYHIPLLLSPFGYSTYKGS